MPRADDLRDDFTDSSISTSAWVSDVDGSATVVETSGQIRFTLPSSTAGTHIARLTSRYRHDLTAASFFVNIQTMVATGTAAEAFFQLYLDGVNALQWEQGSNTLYARSLVAGVQTDHFSVTWNATTYKYLRIAESAGNILWQSSTTGAAGSWTTRATVAVSALFPVTDLFIDFGALCGNVASPGSFRLDDVNLINPALSTTWRHTRALWVVEVVNKRTQLACDTAGGYQGYLLTADEMDVSGEPVGNIRYWSGPAGGGRLLTEQGTQAAAEAMAVNIPVDGTFDLPEQVQARFFRLYHRSIDGTSNDLREFVPRRLVQAEDIEAESIRALNIAAGAITVDKLDVTLTLTGKTIQTAYNGARVVLSGDTYGGLIGYGPTDTYNPLTGAGTYQIIWYKVDGKFYAGDGKVRLDTSGIGLEVGAASVTESEITWFHPTSAGFSSIIGATHDTGAGNAIAYWIVEPQSGNDSAISINANSSIGGLRAGLQILGSDQVVRVNVANFEVASGDTFLVGGLNVGTATGAPDGTIIAQITDAVTSGVTNAHWLRHVSTGTPAAGFGMAQYWQLETSNHTMSTAFQLNVTWATATNGSQKARGNFFVYDTAARTVIATEASGSAPMLGLLGNAAITRPTVTGVRTGTLAQLQTVVANMLTAMANLGGWTDSTT